MHSTGILTNAHLNIKWIVELIYLFIHTVILLCNVIYLSRKPFIQLSKNINSLDETLSCIRYHVGLEKTFKPNFPFYSDHEQTV